MSAAFLLLKGSNITIIISQNSNHCQRLLLLKKDLRERAQVHVSREAVGKRVKADSALTTEPDLRFDSTTLR